MVFFLTSACIIFIQESIVIVWKVDSEVFKSVEFFTSSYFVGLFSEIEIQSNVKESLTRESKKVILQKYLSSCIIAVQLNFFKNGSWLRLNFTYSFGRILCQKFYTWEYIGNAEKEIWIEWMLFLNWRVVHQPLNFRRMF